MDRFSPRKNGTLISSLIVVNYAEIRDWNDTFYARLIIYEGTHTMPLRT